MGNSKTAKREERSVKSGAHDHVRTVINLQISKKTREKTPKYCQNTQKNGKKRQKNDKIRQITRLWQEILSTKR